MAADPQVLTTLRAQADRIRDAIAAYEAKIATAHKDLSAVLTTIALFEQHPDPSKAPAYISLQRVFRRGELSKLCLAALTAEGPLDTRELALRCIRAKGLDEADAVLRKRVGHLIIQALTQFHKRGLIEKGAMRKGVVVWRGHSTPPLSR